MKKTLLALTFAAFAHFGASAQGYNFVKSTGTYTDLVTSTVASTPGWDEDDFSIPIGFSFDFGPNTYTNLSISGNGNIAFISGSGSTIDIKAFFGFAADLMDRGTTTTLSPIGYNTTGVVGSRITKIEWKNAGFYDAAGSQAAQADIPFPNDYVNFQIWLFEGSNKIEVHIGTSAIAAANSSAIFGPTGGPAVAAFTTINIGQPTTFTGQALQGAAATPTIIAVNNSSTPPALTGVPATGVIYTFNRTVTGLTKTLDNPQVSVYPNPAADVLNIEGLTAAKGNVTVKITDVVGKEVMRQEMPAATLMQLNVASLNKGAYFVEINNGTERIAKSMIKQ